MRHILISSLGVALLLAVAGCKSSNSGGDSMGSMKMGSDNSMSKPPATMPATMPM